MAPTKMIRQKMPKIPKMPHIGRRQRPPTLWERMARPLAFGATAAGGGAIGAMLAHMFDPDRGRARRAKLESRTIGRFRRAAHKTTRAVDRRAHFAAGKLQGARHATVGRVGRVHIGHHHNGERPDDATLAQKVRSQVLGRPEFGGSHISVDACQGVIHLRGEMTSEKLMDRLAHKVAHVDGVDHVESYLHLPGQPAPNKAASLNAH